MPYEEEITRRSVLAEALIQHEIALARASKGGRKLEPMRGYTKEFNREQRKCEILREMIRALESEQVRQAMADWQKEEMTGNRQTGLFAPEMAVVFREAEDGHTEDDVPDYPEGRGVSGRDDPLLDGPEMEQQPVGRVEDEDPGEGQERCG